MIIIYTQCVLSAFRFDQEKQNSIDLVHIHSSPYMDSNYLTVQAVFEEFSCRITPLSDMKNTKKKKKYGLDYPPAITKKKELIFMHITEFGWAGNTFIAFPR